ncbi:MAG: cobalamin-dependent protein [Methanomassiliicoccales archaeon]|nr:MAG: cobalamin-dependent protein [Methanomassiliicoccales archaeon]
MIKMRVLLIFPPGESFVRYPPLGLCYIASILERENHDVKIIDASLEHKNVEDILKEVNKFNPEVVGLNTLTNFYHSCKEISLNVKKNFPDLTVIAGGPHVSVLPQQTLKDMGVDYIVVGEGELTILELLKTIEKGSDLSKVNGIGYIENDKIIMTSQREFLQNLDEIPFPARHLLKIKKYNRATIVRQKPYTTILSSRGCPFDCSFCCNAVLWGRKYRLRSPKNVVEEMEEVHSKFNIKEIYFPDDLFTGNRKWVTEVCNEIMKTKIDFTWRCLCRVDTVNEKLLQLMNKSGCHTLEFGVESGDEQIIKNINKKIKINQVINAFSMAKKIGFDTRAFFMIGNIGETEKSINRTMSLAKRLNPDYLSYSIATPLPGTKFFKEAREKKLIVNDDWENYDYTKEAVSKTEALSSEDIKYWQNTATMNFFARREYLSENILRRSLSVPLHNRYVLLNLLNKFRLYTTYRIQKIIK